MTEDEFNNLKVGDIVINTRYGYTTLVWEIVTWANGEKEIKVIDYGDKRKYYIFTNKELTNWTNWSNLTNSIPNWKKEPVTQGQAIYYCEHEWINVGFNSIKMVCKKCDMEKPK